MQKILLTIITIILTLPLMLFANGKTANRSYILNKIESKGSINIIMQIKVPDIDQLTFTSASSPNANKAALLGMKLTKIQIAQTVAADTTLSNQIKRTTDLITSDLGIVDANIKNFKTIPYVKLTVDSDLLLLLENDNRIINIAEDKAMPLPDIKQTSSVFDSMDLSAPLLNNSVGAIKADDAWAAGYTGTGWYVAILDTGIRTTHEMFAGKTIIEACRATGYTHVHPGGDCPNGTATQNGTGSAVHYDLATYTGAGHGTHVSGIAAGQSASLSGVAKDADIIAINVFSRFNDTDGDCGGGGSCVLTWGSDQIAGLEYIYSLRTTYSIGAANMSLGGGSYSSACDATKGALTTAIDNLRTAGIATVIATGNDSDCSGVSAPSCISSAISVGATNDSAEETSFSNSFTGLVDIYAPGSAINSAVPDSDTAYASWYGTSMATPHIAGAWTLYRQRYPLASVDDIESSLKSSATSVTYRCGSPSNGKFVDVIGTMNDYNSNDPINISITVNSNAAETTSDSVTLSLSASSNQNIDGYYVSENTTTPAIGDFTAVGATAIYSADIAFSLSAGYGIKTVYTWYKNISNNISTVKYDSILYVNADSPRNASILINGGADTTPNSSITLALAATDTVGITGYYVSENNATPTADDFTATSSSVNYSASISYTLSEEYGNKTVYAWFIDIDDNISFVVSDTISMLDTIPPIAISMIINNGSTSTVYSRIPVELVATDNLGVTGYYMSEDNATPTTGEFISITSTPTYTGSSFFSLSSDHGSKTIYAWFIDTVGNISNPVSSSINFENGTSNDSSSSSGGGCSVSTTPTYSLSILLLVLCIRFFRKRYL